MKFSRMALAALACAGLLTYTGLASAQFSGRPIRIVVPFAPGGGQEILARSFNSELATALGQAVIVENRAGAGGAVGTAYVAKAAADGQTLIIAGTSHTISALLSSKPQYDPVKDFAGVAYIGTASQVLLIDAKLPAKTVSEFVAHTKANPGKLNYGSAGSGSSTHLSMAYFASLAGLNMAHIPYKSNAEPLTDLVGGRIQAVNLPSISAMQYAKDERVRLLAVTSKERTRFLPDLPTIGETVPGYVYESWFGLLARAGTPKPIVDRINSEMAKLLKNPLIQGRLEKLGIEQRAMSPEDFDKLLHAEYDRVSAIIKLSGATID